MKRFILEKLVEWKKSKYRKPLILKGARQIGKTYILKQFSKHTQNSEANKISLIWNSIPSQLAKENKKFLYQTIKEGARAREYENSH